MSQKILLNHNEFKKRIHRNEASFSSVQIKTSVISLVSPRVSDEISTMSHTKLTFAKISAIYNEFQNQIV